jgi:serine/threonine-protein kinase
VHPNVVGVFDTGELGDRPYIVMERLPGATLADRLREGRMDEPGTRRLASEVLGALAAAHAAGIVHRDVKPSNILWTRDGSVKVADFGIAKGLEPLLDTQSGDITGTNLVIGTPAYLAPERLAGERATPSSDLWSLGAVLYEALAGVRPFSRATALAHDPERPEPVPLEVRRPGVDPRLAAAIDRALARYPDQRFASAAEMAAAAGLSLAGASAAAGADAATAKLATEPVGPTALMDGRTAVLGGDEVAQPPVSPPGPPAGGDQGAGRLRAVALLAVVLVALAAIGIALALRGTSGSTPTTTTTSVPATTAVTRPPTTRPPVTTTTSAPTTTTTSPTTTSSSSTTTSSTTSTTSGVLGPGGGRDHKAADAANSDGG